MPASVLPGCTAYRAAGAAGVPSWPGGVLAVMRRWSGAAGRVDDLRSGITRGAGGRLSEAGGSADAGRCQDDKDARGEHDARGLDPRWHVLSLSFHGDQRGDAEARRRRGEPVGKERTKRVRLPGGRNARWPGGGAPRQPQQEQTHQREQGDREATRHSAAAVAAAAAPNRRRRSRRQRQPASGGGQLPGSPGARAGRRFAATRPRRTRPAARNRQARRGRSGAGTGRSGGSGRGAAGGGGHASGAGAPHSDPCQRWDRTGLRTGGHRGSADSTGASAPVTGASTR